VYDKDTRNCIAAIMTRMANNQYSDEMRQIWTGSKGLALPKDNGGIRPIAIGEIMYRAATHILLNRISSAIAEAVGTHQYGLNVACGTEAVPHIVQAALMSPTPIAVLHLDTANAFNTRQRSSILNSLFSKPQLASIWRIAHMSYSKPSPVYFQNKQSKIVLTVWSKEGVRQGCGLGTTAFDNDLEETLELASQIDEEVEVLAVHDDVYFYGPPERLRKPAEFFVSKMKEKRSVVQPTKSELAYFHDAPISAAVRDFIAEWNLKLSTDSLVVAGAIVAKNEQAAAKLAHDAVAEMGPFMQRIEHPHLPTQHALILLRQSGQAGIDYVLRTSRPALIASAVAEFDDETMRTVTAKTSIAFPPGSTKAVLARLPIALGGLGFRAKSMLAPIAFWASEAACAKLIGEAKNTLNEDTTRCRQVILDGFRAAIQSDASLRVLEHRLPESADHFVDFYTSHPEFAYQIQAALTEIITRRDVGLIKPKSQTERVRQASTADQDSSRYLTTVPTSDELKLSDMDLQLAVKDRVGDSPTSTTPAACGNCLRLIGSEETNHALTCIANTPTTKTMRHNKIAATIAKWARNAGAAASTEPRGYIRNTDKRPDVQVDFSLNTTFLDVVISNSIAPSNLRKKDVKKANERRKDNTYKQDLKEDGFLFKPFALDAFGSLGQPAREFVNELAAHASQNSTMSPKEIKNGLLNELSIVLMRCNSRITQRAICDGHRKERQMLAMQQSQQMAIDAAVTAASC
jgi:hypothetical protein